MNITRVKYNSVHSIRLKSKMFFIPLTKKKLIKIGPMSAHA